MISSVRGPLLALAPDHAVVEAAGIGYRLNASTHTLAQAPELGSEWSLFTQLVVREDSMQLYGFAADDERELFKMLTQVSGVGPKVALAVLSSGSPREIRNALASEDTVRFQAVSGIGKRTAERLVVELKDRAGALGALDEIVMSNGGDARTVAREGLLGLGYSLPEAESLLQQADGSTAEELISASLRVAAGDRG